MNKWMEESDEFRQLVRHRTLTGKNHADNFHLAWCVVYVKDGETCETESHLEPKGAIEEAMEACK